MGATNRGSFLETLRNDLQNKYLDAVHNFEPLFDLEAFKLCSDSIFPSVIFWGPQHRCFFNEAFAALIKINSSTFFGKEAGTVFNNETWRFFLPQVENVLESHNSLGAEGQLVYLDRKGFLEECYLDYSLEPIMVGDMVQGVFCQIIESTKRMVDQRRMEMISQLAYETLKARTLTQACSMITTILNRYTSDVPFTLTYLLKSQDQRDLCTAGVDKKLKDIFNNLEFSEDEMTYIDGLKNSVSKAVLIPIKNIGQSKPFCMIILGISPTLELNEDYKAFHLLLSRFLSTILTKIQMLESKQRDLVARDEFISIASHEFKTPITALKLRLALTKRKIDVDKKTGPTPEEMIECIKTADQQADRLTSLVDELLDMTRIQRGKFQFSYEQMEVCAMIDEVIERFKEEMQRSGNTLDFDRKGDIMVHWHRSRMDQVLSNLISNSLKYAPGSKICIVPTQLDNKIKIEFSDNGPGIPKEKQLRIFNRFEGGHSSQRVEGLGLGLYIVREIIKGHNGTIEVQSEEGKGTKFTILLPQKP